MVQASCDALTCERVNVTHRNELVVHAHCFDEASARCPCCPLFNEWCDIERIDTGDLSSLHTFVESDGKQRFGAFVEWEMEI